MKKMLKNLRVKLSLLWLCLFLSSISVAKVRIRGDFDIWIGNSNSRSKPTKSVGNMDDHQFIEKPFVINNKGYVFLKDNYNNKLLLRVVFDTRGRVIREDLYYTQKFTENCIGVQGNDSFCFTITSNGFPAVWDRFDSRYLYYGKFINNVRINNPYKSRDYYEQDFFGDLFQF